MTVASIFYFEFWFPWGVVLNAFLVAFWSFADPKGVPWSLLGKFGGPLGDFLGSLDVLLAAVLCLGGPLGVPGGSWDFPWRLGGDFREIPGGRLAPF